MSETEIEEVEETELGDGEGADEPLTDPDTPDEDEELDGEEGEEGDPDGFGEPEAQYQPGMAESRYLDEKALAKIAKQLDGEGERHAKRLREILGDGMEDYIPCPTCFDEPAGLIIDPEVKPLDDGQRERMLQVLGLNKWAEMSTAEWARQCSTCLGHGAVKTGSYVHQRETVECMDCGGYGYINTRKQSSVTALHSPEGEIVTGPTVFENADPDPRVDALRRDGFTVIPPIQVAQ